MASPSSVYPGDISKMYPAGQERGERVAAAAGSAADRVKDVITSGAGVASFLSEHWKILIVGFLAVLLLLRR